jgi:uncharacterized membrane protein (UPF0127 family)
VSENRIPLRFRRLPLAQVAGREVPVATSLLSRLLGLALLSLRAARDGLLIPRCRSVHTFGMRFPLHIVFLDERRVPISVQGAVPPCRVVRDCRAAFVLELPARRGTGPGSGR